MNKNEDNNDRCPELYIQRNYNNICKRFLYICSRIGKPDLYMDVANEYCVAILENKSKHQTLDQFFVDYSRANGYCKHKKIKTDTTRKFAKIISNSAEGFHHKSYDKINIATLIPNDLDVTTRAMILLQTKWGLHCNEIGELFAMSGANVTLKIQALKKKRPTKSTIIVKNRVNAALEGRLNREIAKQKARNNNLQTRMDAISMENDRLRNMINSEIGTWDLEEMKVSLIRKAVVFFKTKTEAAKHLGISLRTVRNQTNGRRLID